MNWYDEAVEDEPVIITLDTFEQIAPHCPDPDTWLDVLDRGLSRQGIFDLNEIALFLAQTSHESTDYSRLSEGFNYAEQALLSVFGSHRISAEDARRLGRNDDHPADREGIANHLYGGEWGLTHLGNTESDDGFRYRGRGIIQLTGRDNYTRCARATGLDLVDQPDLLSDEPEAAVEAALWFWAANVWGQDIKTTTRQINPGMVGFDDRVRRYRRIKRLIAA
ncbi:glycoside hydrolase family 19 protein [Larsenimonas suaedae]|uniref:Glycoside hydrolase family 19 protein n=1 Tax=Larsenimonas suaedae TaxID=1851019 RepID=A0ABU1GYX4_9GAMM|nr:glycoside hydrolase family 19 protein [Larsenimonas suaedae]MCM2973737.1 hypothetical protein [Larsenimonas suaedae]MDR5897260.1 glycoside hydrolase family 19 protein [Larsenimonas suaedae]